MYRTGLYILFGFNVFSILGYGIFGLHPHLLATMPGAAEIYAVSFEFFAQAQVIIGALVLFDYFRVNRFKSWLGAGAAVYILSLTSELSGTSTGLPFGPYMYTPLLGFKIFDHVPWTIPLSWFYMTVPAYWVGSVIAGVSHGWKAKMIRAGVTGYILVLWDVALDPAMSFLNSYWVWFEAGAYYTMPWINWVGWFVTGIVLSLAVDLSKLGSWLQKLDDEWMVVYAFGHASLPLGMVIAAGIWPVVGAFVAALIPLAIVYRWARSQMHSQGHDGGTRTVEDSEEITFVREIASSALNRAATESEIGHYRAQGNLLRAIVAAGSADCIAVAPDDHEIVSSEDQFWRAVLSVQLAHEASLIHDDVIDNAAVRRGLPTVVRSRGVGAAIVTGDRLLTQGYRLAGEVNDVFLRAYTTAVDEVVAGEMMQAKHAGDTIDLATYDAIVRKKTGSLFGLAVATDALLKREANTSAYVDLGEELGVLYQMMDDLLDYCQYARTGKQALQDYRQGKWTFPLLFSDMRFGLDRRSVLRSMTAYQRGTLGLAPLEDALLFWQDRKERWMQSASGLLGRTPMLQALLDQWDEKLTAAVVHEVGQRDMLWDIFAAGSRTFSTAARLLPATAREAVTAVYAWCRLTDDITDAAPHSSAEVASYQSRRMDRWVAMTQDAHAGKITGSAALNQAMQVNRTHDAPVEYPHALIKGMRLDLDPDREEGIAVIRDKVALENYTFHAASVVGLWLSRLWGVTDKVALEQAALLGHAMQLSNIARDVGEDWGRGRMYLPMDWLAEEGITLSMIRQHGSEIAKHLGYQRVVKRVLDEADEAYDVAIQGIAALPAVVRWPVAAAALMYQAIGQTVRANNYDNWKYRATTNGMEKLAISCSALVTALRISYESNQANRVPAKLGSIAPNLRMLVHSIAGL